MNLFTPGRLASTDATYYAAKHFPTVSNSFYAHALWALFK